MDCRKSIAIPAFIAAVGLLLLASCQKKCKDPRSVDFPQEVHAYMQPFHSGSWWACGIDGGTADTLHVQGYREVWVRTAEVEGECLQMAGRTFRIETTHAGIGTLQVEYEMYKPGHCQVKFGGTTPLGRYTMRFAHVDGVFVDAIVGDTVVNGVEYRDALVVHRPGWSEGTPDAWPEGSLRSLLLAKGVGVVACVAGPDTLMLINYNVP